MAHIWLYSLVSVILVSLLSFIGIILFSLKTATLKKVVLYLVSFSAGGLFGDAFIHLLPEAIEEAGLGFHISLYVILGIVVSFIVEKVVHWRHCHLTATKEHVHPFAIMNLWGDAVHNFIDGVIIAISYYASMAAGLATTIAVLAHEIPQEIGDFGVLIHGGFSKKKALLMNFLSALTAVIGAIVALILVRHVTGLTTFLIPFAAGSFIYIAGVDLIPELHKETKVSKSLMQLFVFILGVLVMVALTFLE